MSESIKVETKKFDNIAIDNRFALKPKRGKLSIIKKNDIILTEGEFALVQQIDPENEDLCFGGAILIGDGERLAKDLPYFIKDSQVEVKELQKVTVENKNEIVVIHESIKHIELNIYNIDNKLRILYCSNLFLIIAIIVLLINQFGI